MNINQYQVRQSFKNRSGFGNYEYDIIKDNLVIAKYWHDYRGNDHGINFNDGITRDFPFVVMTDFLDGGGPHPLILTFNALQ